MARSGRSKVPGDGAHFPLTVGPVDTPPSDSLGAHQVSLDGLKPKGVPDPLGLNQTSGAKGSGKYKEYDGKDTSME